jgi:hypothetical protein
MRHILHDKEALDQQIVKLIVLLQELWENKFTVASGLTGGVQTDI